MFGELQRCRQSAAHRSSLGGLVHFLGNVWADRIKQSTLAQFQKELASLSAEHTRVLESFKAKAAAALKACSDVQSIAGVRYQQRALRLQ